MAFPHPPASQAGRAHVELEASTLELDDEDSDDDSDDEVVGKGRYNWLVSGGKDRRVALWELMNFNQTQ